MADCEKLGSAMDDDRNYAFKVAETLVIIFPHVYTNENEVIKIILHFCL